MSVNSNCIQRKLSDIYLKENKKLGKRVSLIKIVIHSAA